MSDNTRIFTRKNVDGFTIIRSKIGKSQLRAGYEKTFFPAIEVGLEGWHRAHSQPAQLGVENKEGILYAPPNVNLVFQARVEKYIRQFFENKIDNVDIYLTTETSAHPRTRRLCEISYTVEAVIGNKTYSLFEVTIEVENKRDEPKVYVKGQVFNSLDPFVKAKKTTSVIA